MNFLKGLFASFLIYYALVNLIEVMSSKTTSYLQFAGAVLAPSWFAVVLIQSIFHAMKEDDE